MLYVTCISNINFFDLLVFQLCSYISKLLNEKAILHIEFGQEPLVHDVLHIVHKLP